MKFLSIFVAVIVLFAVTSAQNQGGGSHRRHDHGGRNGRRPHRIDHRRFDGNGDFRSNLNFGSEFDAEGFFDDDNFEQNFDQNRKLHPSASHFDDNFERNFGRNHGHLPPSFSNEESGSEPEFDFGRPEFNFGRPEFNFGRPPPPRHKHRKPSHLPKPTTPKSEVLIESTSPPLESATPEFDILVESKTPPLESATPEYDILVESKTPAIESTTPEFDDPFETDDETD